MVDWIRQDDKSIMGHCTGSTVLIKFKNTSDGITADDNSTIDLSWMRSKEKIHATTGDYTECQIKEWAII